MGKTKRKLIMLYIAAATCAVALPVAVTYAGYSALAKAEQGVGYLGKVKKSIFLNANIWSTDSPAYYINAFGDNGQTWYSCSKIITPTINSTGFTLYVFEVDADLYTGINFVRMNPNAASLPSWDAKWNQTANITLRSDVNYYCIKTWDDGSENHYSTYEINNIRVNGDALEFTNPS